MATFCLLLGRLPLLGGRGLGLFGSWLLGRGLFFGHCLFLGCGLRRESGALVRIGQKHRIKSREENVNHHTFFFAVVFLAGAWT